MVAFHEMICLDEVIWLIIPFNNEAGCNKRAKSTNWYQDDGLFLALITEVFES